MKQSSWQQITDQLDKWTETETTYVRKRQARQYGEGVGTGAAPGGILEGETLLEYKNVGRYKDNSTQASWEL